MFRTHLHLTKVEAKVIAKAIFDVFVHPLIYFALRLFFLFPFSPTFAWCEWVLSLLKSFVGQNKIAPHFMAQNIFAYS